MKFKVSCVRPLKGFIPTNKCDKYEVKKRVSLLKSFINLSNKVILDVGCGNGIYTDKLRRHARKVYSLDVDKEAVRRAKCICPCVILAAGEFLPFADGSFDLIFANDVLEHVGDDKQVVEEAYRCVKENGYIMISVPNRLFPFEVHGILFRGRRFGIKECYVPLINYLPDSFRNRLVPHARAYSIKSISRLFESLPVRFICWQYIFPPWEIFETDSGLKRALTKLSSSLEKSPLKMFGDNHFLIVLKRRFQLSR